MSIVYGSASGVNTAKKTVISQNTTGVPGTAESADHFGFSLTSLDYDEDGYADLLVGTPDEDTTAGADAGLETILWGSPSGLVGTDSQAMAEPEAPARSTVSATRWSRRTSTATATPTGSTPRPGTACSGRSVTRVPRRRGRRRPEDGRAFHAQGHTPAVRAGKDAKTVAAAADTG